MKGSSITAVDKVTSNVKVQNGIHLKIKTGDFLQLDFDNSDGILIANALHYVKDQPAFIKQLAHKTKRLIVVEYNTDKGNQWVPYPISFNKLNTITAATRIGTEHSAYHQEGMYSALILF